MTDHTGQPQAIGTRGGWVPVAEVLDRWLVEDGWWREPVARRYLRLILADGRLLTLFEDLIAGGWYAQRYALPVTGIPAVFLQEVAGSQ